MESRKLSRRKEVSGCFPEFGAIFMSNRSTLQECFEKRLLGLPNTQSGFVRRVKAGMTLFLFEFEERKLYGVFEAISDGGMNIDPQAYVSTGRSFPAQVKFAIIWRCDPLFEDEFHDAIRDNYFGTYKFNFGLSNEEIGNLLWLFSSRKLEIPKTPQHKKRKNRKQDYKSTKGGGKKGRFAKIEIFRRKLDIDHGNSDISEAEVERHFLSSDPCIKSEKIHFDDDVYDPENPGFHHSVISEALSVASHESHELLTLRSKKENFHISAKDNEEYIPLCLPDHFADPEEEGFGLRECSGAEQLEIGIFVDNKLAPIPVPQLPFVPNLSDEGYNHSKMEQPFAASNGNPWYRSDDLSSAALSLSDVDLPSKDGNNHFKPRPSKGMYSDNLKKRASVFSRLIFPSKDITSRKQNDLRMKLANHISRVKQQSHVECEEIHNVTPQKNETEGPYVDDRTSEYFPLTSASYNVPQKLLLRNWPEGGKVEEEKQG